MNAPVPESKKCPPFGKLKRKKCAACKNHLPARDLFDETKKTQVSACMASAEGAPRPWRPPKRPIGPGAAQRVLCSIESVRPPHSTIALPVRGDKKCIVQLTHHLPPYTSSDGTKKTCKRACETQKRKKRDKIKKDRAEVDYLRQEIPPHGRESPGQRREICSPQPPPLLSTPWMRMTSRRG